jgi:hypothetical protein
MNLRLPIALVLLLLALSSTAQDQAPKPVGPVPRQAPSNCSWTVRHKQNFSDKEDSWEQAFKQEDTPPGGDAAIIEARHIKRRKLEKNEQLKTYHVSTSWSDGKTQDDWIVMGHHVAERAGERGLYVAGAESSLGAELSASDFPELAWLDLKYYRGLKTHKGQLVFVFAVSFNDKPMSTADRRYYNFVKQRAPKATPKEVFKPKYERVVAYLDAKTQLPVLYNDGSVLRHYSFSSAKSFLRPPKKIIAFLRKREATLRTKTATPAGPGPKK